MPVQPGSETQHHPKARDQLGLGIQVSKSAPASRRLMHSRLLASDDTATTER